MLLQSHEHMSALSARDDSYQVAVGTSCGSAMVIDVRKAGQGVLSTRHLSANSNEAVTQVHWQINAFNTYSLVKKVKEEAAAKARAGAGQGQRTAQVQAAHSYLGRAAEATPVQADTLQVSCCTCGARRCATGAGDHTPWQCSTGVMRKCQSTHADILLAQCKQLNMSPSAPVWMAMSSLPGTWCFHKMWILLLHEHVDALHATLAHPAPPALTFSPTLPAYSPQASCQACPQRTHRAL